MAIEQLINPSDQPEGKRIVYLVEREGGMHTREFENRRKCHKYLRNRHDSVVSYKEYLITVDGKETFVKEGTFKPRTAEQKRKSRAKLRRKRRARQRTREAAKREMQSNRPTKW